MGYIDAFYPADQQAASELLPPPVMGFLRDVASKYGEGWRLPAGDGQLDMWALEPGSPAREYVRQNLCDFSLSCFDSKPNLPNHVAEGKPKGVLLSTKEGYQGRGAFQPSAERARSQGAVYEEIPTGHDSHVERPGEVAAFLEKLGT
jgi:hypothetical protein